MKLMRADCMAVMNATPLRSAMLEPSESSWGYVAWVLQSVESGRKLKVVEEWARPPL